MTNLNLTIDAVKPVAILNSGDHSAQYAHAPKSESAEADPMLETLLRSIDTRLQTMDGRLDKMDGRLDKMDARFDKMDARFDKLDARFDKMDARLDKVGEDIVELKVQSAAITTRLDNIDAQFCRTELRFDRTDVRLDHFGECFARLDNRHVDTVARLERIEVSLSVLPTWRGVGATAVAGAVGCGGLLMWLTDGGAKALTKIFD